MHQHHGAVAIQNEETKFICCNCVCCIVMVYQVERPNNNNVKKITKVADMQLGLTWPLGGSVGHALLVWTVSSFHLSPSTIWDDVNKYMLEHKSWIYKPASKSDFFSIFFQSEKNRRRSLVQSGAGRHILPCLHLWYHPLILKHSHHWKIKAPMPWQ